MRLSIKDQDKYVWMLSVVIGNTVTLKTQGVGTPSVTMATS